MRVSSHLVALAAILVGHARDTDSFTLDVAETTSKDPARTRTLIADEARFLRSAGEWSWCSLSQPARLRTTVKTNRPRGVSWASEAERDSRGSATDPVSFPSTHTWKWRWTPVQEPVQPARPISWPCGTRSPRLTNACARWAYIVTMPPLVPDLDDQPVALEVASASRRAITFPERPRRPSCAPTPRCRSPRAPVPNGTERRAEIPVQRDVKQLPVGNLDDAAPAAEPPLPEPGCPRQKDRGRRAGESRPGSLVPPLVVLPPGGHGQPGRLPVQRATSPVQNSTTFPSGSVT